MSADLRGDLNGRNNNNNNGGERSFDSAPDFMMSPQEVRAYAQGNRRKAVVLSPEAKLMLNCSHRGENGQPLVRSETQTMQDLNGNTSKVQVLKCQYCGAVINPISELEYKRIKGELMPLVTKVSDYIKVFDPRFGEPVREILVTWGYETLLVCNILDETMKAGRNKNKNKNNQQRRMTSADMFNRR